MLVVDQLVNAIPSLRQSPIHGNIAFEGPPLETGCSMAQPHLIKPTSSLLPAFVCLEGLWFTSHSDRFHLVFPEVFHDAIKNDLADRLLV